MTPSPGAKGIRIELPTPQATHEFGRRLGERLRAGDLILLAGDLGAGKTALTQGIGAGLGVVGQVASPTFVLARVHRPAPGRRVGLVHVDAYRLSGALELDDLDLDSELTRSAVVVEWGTGLAERLGDAHLRIDLERRPDDRRIARISPVGGDWARRLASLTGTDG